MNPADRRRWLALYTLCAGVLMIVLDATRRARLARARGSVDRHDHAGACGSAHGNLPGGSAPGSPYVGDA